MPLQTCATLLCLKKLRNISEGLNLKMYYSRSRPATVQEEKHVKLLKQMMQQECNKNCFECNQRGPTYVDITIGSFVCTSCGGILRGLNKPHRVKSISMASFTPSEIAFVESKGNDYCNATYLGKYKNQAEAKFDCKDPIQLKKFMEQKYDQKCWYVSPKETNKPLESFMKSIDSGNRKLNHSDRNGASESATATDKISLVEKTNHGVVPVLNNKSGLSDITLSVRPKIEDTTASFADFSQAFPPSQNFDSFGSLTSEDTSAASSTSFPATSFGDFGKARTPSSMSFTATEKMQTTKNHDKYADLGDLFKLESSEISANLWDEFENRPNDKSKASVMPSPSNVQQPQNQSRNLQSSSFFSGMAGNNQFGSNSGQTVTAFGANNIPSQQVGAMIQKQNFAQSNLVPATPTFNMKSFASSTNTQNFFPSYTTSQAATTQLQTSALFGNPANSVVNSKLAPANPFGVPLNSPQHQIGCTNPFMTSQTPSNQVISQPSTTNPFVSQINISANPNQFSSNPFFD